MDGICSYAQTSGLLSNKDGSIAINGQHTRTNRGRDLKFNKAKAELTKKKFIYGYWFIGIDETVS